MINTGPMGKSASAIAGAPIGGMAKANAPLARRQPPPRRPPMGGGASAGMRPNPMGGKSIKGQASGSGIGPSFAMNPGFKSVNATGAIGPQSQFGGPSPMGPSPMQRFQGDPLMAAGGGGGPVMETAPPMFEEPPMMGGGGMMPGMEQGGNPMLSGQYGGQEIMAPRGARDPRFRY